MLRDKYLPQSFTEERIKQIMSSALDSLMECDNALSFEFGDTRADLEDLSKRIWVANVLERLCGREPGWIQSDWIEGEKHLPFRAINSVMDKLNLYARKWKYASDDWRELVSVHVDEINEQIKQQIERITLICGLRKNEIHSLHEGSEWIPDDREYITNFDRPEQLELRELMAVEIEESLALAAWQHLASLSTTAAKSQIADREPRTSELPDIADCLDPNGLTPDQLTQIGQKLLLVGNDGKWCGKRRDKHLISLIEIEMRTRHCWNRSLDLDQLTKRQIIASHFDVQVSDDTLKRGIKESWEAEQDDVKSVFQEVLTA